MLLHELLGVIGIGLLCAAAGYETVASLAVLVFELRRAVALRVASGRVQQPVTVLKPLCGAEPGLYENLRSFCLQE
jgi:ceramide glucosyltransferase